MTMSKTIIAFHANCPDGEVHLCSMSDCRKPATSKKASALCSAHSERKRLYGNPELTSRLIASNQELFRFWALIRQPGDECIIWGEANGGYPTVGHAGRPIALHRLSCRSRHGGPPSDRHQAAHSCGRRPCINPNHLRWATQSENEADKVAHGLANRGSRTGTAKLNEGQVDEIRHRRAAGEKLRVLSEEFGVAETTICALTKGRRWVHHETKVVAR